MHCYVVASVAALGGALLLLHWLSSTISTLFLAEWGWSFIGAAKGSYQERKTKSWKTKSWKEFDEERQAEILNASKSLVGGGDQ